VKHLLIILSILLLSSFITSCGKNGHGTETYSTGVGRSKYVGEFLWGNRHGKGTMTFPNGISNYVGEFRWGKQHGQGTWTWSDGENYSGEWKDGKYHGQGTETWLFGRKYVGEYKDGVKNGQGTLTLSDGEKYEGEWKNGKRWEGKQLNKNGKITEIYFLGIKGKYYEPSSVNNSPLPDWLFYFMTSSFLPPELYVEDLRPFLSILSYNLTNWVRKFDFKKKDNRNRYTWLDFTFFQWCFTILFLLPVILILRIIFIEKFKVLKSNKDKEGS